MHPLVKVLTASLRRPTQWDEDPIDDVIEEEVVSTPSTFFKYVAIIDSLTNRWKK